MAQSSERIINGKIYDIEYSRFLGAWDNGYYHRTDIEWLSLALELNENGDYYLIAEGNDEEKLREISGEYYHEENIYIPLTPEEAREWAFIHLTEKEFIYLFGKDENRTKITVWVHNDILKRADNMKIEKGYTIQDVFAAGVEALERKTE